MLPKCIARVPVLRSSATLVKTMPIRSTIVTAAKYPDNGVVLSNRKLPRGQRLSAKVPIAQAVHSVDLTPKRLVAP